MSYATVLDMVREALLFGLMLAGPLLGVALAVGLVIALLQAVTQVQEQTLVFVVKLVAVGVVFLLTLNWTLQAAVRYTVELFRSLPGMVS